MVAQPLTQSLRDFAVHPGRQIFLYFAALHNAFPLNRITTKGLNYGATRKDCGENFFSARARDISGKYSSSHLPPRSQAADMAGLAGSLPHGQHLSFPLPLD